MEYDCFQQTFTVKCAFLTAHEPQICGTLRGYPNCDNAAVYSVYPLDSKVTSSPVIGFICPERKYGKSFTINAVATTIYQIITEKALQFATVVSAVVKGVWSRCAERRKVWGRVPETRKVIKPKVLLSCAGGLRL